MSTSPFWKTVGDFLRGKPHGLNGENGQAIGAALGTLGHERSYSATALLSPPRRSRPATSAQVREGYERVIDLVGSMREHMERQGRDADRLNAAVERMAVTLERLADVQSGQNAAVHSIASNVETASRTQAALSSTMAELPASLQAQAEAVRAMARELQVSHISDAQLVHSLERFGHAAEALREAGSAQMETMKELRAGDREQRSELRSFEAVQQRRFVVASILVAALAIVGVSVTSIGVFLLLWN